MAALCFNFCVALADANRSEEPMAKPEPATGTETIRLNQWLDDQFKAYLDFSPLAKTRLGIKTDYGVLDDNSPEMDDLYVNWRLQSVSQMQRLFNRADLTEEGKRSFDLWRRLSVESQKNVRFRFHRYVFGRRGPHTGLPNGLINYHKVDSLSDMQAYVSRLGQSGRYLTQALDKAKLSASKGIRAPYFDYQVAISQIQRVTQGQPFTEKGESPIWKDIVAKMESLVARGEISSSQARDLTEQASLAITNSMLPAYIAIKGWLEADLENVSAQAQGASALPEGKAYYQYALERMTTLPLKPLEVHELGLVEVARIQQEMREIMAQVGFDGTLQDFFRFLRSDDQFYFENSDQGRQGYLSLARDYLLAMKVRLPEFFGILPQGALEVRRVEAFREQPGAAAHYMRGTQDGSRPGVFYVHLSDMRATSMYRLENLAYHEGLPGHHMQIAIQQELENIPHFRTYHGYTAFSEGWGLYAEKLGKDMGFYQDPYSDFGRLSGEIWRAIRLVVDTGIHELGWSEADAIEYAMVNSPRPEKAVKSEVRRYFNMPAQATAYKIGMLKIQALRQLAEKQLGEEFDIRTFHDVILGSGPLPLPMLEQKVIGWLHEKKS
jgi:uncharacterized protein (DUF885 family)